MNIYVVVENQFPDTQLVAIIACKNSNQAYTAYHRMWMRKDEHGNDIDDAEVSGCIEIATCNLEVPEVLWKNFLTPKERQDGNKEITTTDEETSTSEEPNESTGEQPDNEEFIPSY